MCCFCLTGYPQETTYWPIRNGAINLQTVPPTATYSRSKVIFTNTAQCDSFGNLLFYSSGDTVWNRNHDVMEGGGQKLSQEPPQASHATIGVTYSIKNTVNPNLFYIFFLPINSINLNLILYKITIDMSQNSGLGKVIKRDTLVRTPLANLTVKKNSKENSWWLFSYSLFTDSFYIYKFQNDSLSLVNSYKLTFQYILYNFGVTISHNNKFLLFYDTASGLHKIVQYDFNESNGTLTNQGTALDSVSIPKRCILSPNDSIIYNADDNYLTIYNLYTKEKVKYNARPLTSTPYAYFYALKYAPNGKLYYYTYYSNITTNYISEIRYPDKITNQSKFYVYKSSPLSYQSTSTLFPFDEEPITRLEFEYVNTCQGMVFFNRSDTGVFKTFTWYFNDTDIVVQTIPHTNRWNNNPIAVYKKFPLKTGNYFVKIKGTKYTGYNMWGYDSVLYIAPPIAKFTTQSTQGCQYIAYEFNDSSFADTATTAGYSYYWDFGDGTKDEIKNVQSKIKSVKHTYNVSGTYTVRLIFSNGFCSDTFSIVNNVNILPAPKPGFTLSNKRGCTPFLFKIQDTLTSNITLKEYDFGRGFVGLNNNRSLDTTLQINNSGIYIIRQRLMGSTGCVTQYSDTIIIKPGLSKADTINVLFTTVIDSNTTLTKWNTLTNAVSYFIKNKNTVDTFFTDNNVQPYLASEHYFISATDSCGNKSATSPVAQTIYLKGENENYNGYALLEYTPYETWKQGVMQYEIEYFNKISQEWTKLNSESEYVLTTHAEVIPDTSNFNTATSRICYRVKAIERSGNKQLSISNVACVPIYPVVFLPNAFSPNGDGINDYYKPICAGLNSYIFEIYNRWGEQVYSDTPESMGWDGTFRGKKAEEGAYAFRLSAIGLLKSPATNDARVVERKGTLFLVR